MHHAIITDMKESKISIPLFKDRVSPLFDVAGRFIVFHVKGDRVIDRFYFNTGGYSESEIVNLIKSQNIDIVICGAISNCLKNLIINSGTEVLNGIMGVVEDVVAAYLSGKIFSERFMMPGCGQVYCNRKRKGRKNGR